MDRGYLRIRRNGPSEDVQRASLKTAGVVVDGDAAIYVDGLTFAFKRQRIDPNDPLPQRTWAIKHLRAGDRLFVHDAATLGTTTNDILGALAAIGLRKATLFVVELGKEFRWHPEAASIAAVAKQGGDQNRREQTLRARRAARGEKLTPEAKARAKQLWGDPSVASATKVRDVIYEEFGIKVSVRTLYNAMDAGRDDAINGNPQKKKQTPKRKSVAKAKRKAKR